MTHLSSERALKIKKMKFLKVAKVYRLAEPCVYQMVFKSRGGCISCYYRGILG